MFMQSSSASVVLVLTAANSGIVDYRMGAAIIMGAFLGTTITAVLWAMWPFPLKKQVAFSHVLFNLVSAIFWLLFLSWIVVLLENNFADVVLGLSVFAIWFKIVWVLLFSPFVWYFTRFLQYLFPVKETLLWLSLEKVDPRVTEAAIIAMKKDTVKLLKKVFVYVLHIWSVDEKNLLKVNLEMDKVLSDNKSFDESILEQEYANIKMIEEALVAFGSHVKRNTAKWLEVDNVDDLYFAVSLAVSAAKYMKDISHNIRFLEETSSAWFYKQYELFRSMLVRLYKIISEVIDEKHKDEVLPKMLDFVADIKLADKIFLENLTKEVIKEKMKKFDLSDILHINRYVYLSSLSFVDAIKQIFMKSVEKKVFEQLK